MKTGGLRRFGKTVVGSLLIVNTIWVEVTVHFPFLLLLLLPSASARRIFEYIADFWMTVNLTAFFCIIRVFSEVRVLLHMKGGKQALKALKNSPASMLVLSNHRTSMCWAYSWGLGLTLGRLRGWKMVMMEPVRHVPWAGWTLQMSGQVFIDRGVGKERSERSPEKQLEVLREAVRSTWWKSWPSSFVIFPEGKVLLPSSLAASDTYADKNQLKHYQQVLHPKTRGSEEIWKPFSGYEHKPMLLDLTLAFVDFEQGEMPTHLEFAVGRGPKEVHIHVEALEDLSPDSPDLDKLVRSRFEQKEARLTAWYDSPTNEGRKANLSKFLGYEVPKGEENGVDTVLDNLPAVASHLSLLLLAYILVYSVCWFLGFKFISLLTLFEFIFFEYAARHGGVDSYVRWHSLQFSVQKEK